MDEHDAAHLGGSDRDIRDLGRHADNKGEIDEIPGGWFLSTRKFQTGGRLTCGRLIEKMGVVEGRKRVHHCPAKWHRQQGSQPCCQTPSRRTVEDESDCGDACRNHQTGQHNDHAKLFI